MAYNHVYDSDGEGDPDPYLVALELEVARLRAERDYWGQHRKDCFYRDDEVCVCGFSQATKNNLWAGAGMQTINVENALAWWSDDEELQRAQKKETEK